MNQPFERRNSLRRLFVCICIFVWFVLTIGLSSCRPAALPSTINSPLTLNSPLVTPNVPTLTEIALQSKIIAKATDLAQINQTEAARTLLPPPPPGHILPTPPVRVTVAPMSVAFPPITDSDAIPAGAGMIVIRPSTGYGAQYRIGNMWIEDIHNGRTRIEVEAGVENGSDGLPSAQGIVIVEIWQRPVISNSVGVNRIWEGVYPTPAQTGFVKIVSAVGERLTLQSERGTTFYFDVPSHQFVPSMAWVNPNPISPLPTPVGSIATLYQATPTP